MFSLAARSLRSLRPLALPPRAHYLLRLSRTRTYATPSSSPLPLPAGIPPALLEKLSKSPRTREQMQTIMKLLTAKGITMTQQPGVMEMMRLARDEEVVGAVRELKRVMDEEGVVVDLGEVVGGMGRV